MIGRSTLHIATRVLAVMMSMLAAACSSIGAGSADAPGRRMELSLAARFTDKRYTYFEIDRAGQLSFGGGSDAANRIARPVAMLTAEQFDQLDAIIETYNLLDAGSFEKQEPTAVSYRLRLRRDGQKRSIRCVDDQSPGVAALHDQLFKYQAAVRYGRVSPAYAP